MKPIERIAEAGGMRGIQADANIGAVDLVDEIAEFQGGEQQPGGGIFDG